MVLVGAGIARAGLDESSASVELLDLTISPPASSQVTNQEAPPRLPGLLAQLDDRWASVGVAGLGYLGPL